MNRFLYISTRKLSPAIKEPEFKFIQWDINNTVEFGLLTMPCGRFVHWSYIMTTHGRRVFDKVKCDGENCELCNDKDSRLKEFVVLAYDKYGIKVFIYPNALAKKLNPIIFENKYIWYNIEKQKNQIDSRFVEYFINPSISSPITPTGKDLSFELYDKYCVDNGFVSINRTSKPVLPTYEALFS
jgi:hypothetical protein